MATLELRGIQKRYGRTRALDDLELSVRAGEVVGIAGPNGAGKSTLVRLLAGEEKADAGEVVLGGAAWEPGRPLVAVVHQEPRLFTNLTVAQNLVVGREGYRLGRPGLSVADRAVLDELGIGALRRPAARRVLARRAAADGDRARARAGRRALPVRRAELGADRGGVRAPLRADARAGGCGPVRRPRLPPAGGVDRARRARRGDPRRALRDRVSTGSGFRRRRSHASWSSARTTRREPSGLRSRGRRAGPTVLRVRGWTHPRPRFSSVDSRSASARSSRSSASRDPARAPSSRRSPGSKRAQASSRRSRTCTFQPTGAEPLPRPHRQRRISSRGSPGLGVAAAGFLRPRRIARLAAELIDAIRIRTESPSQPIGSLSGGNHQKVALAAAIAAGPRLLLLEEPTRGVDIGSKAGSTAFLREFADRGNGRPPSLDAHTEIPEVFDTRRGGHLRSRSAGRLFTSASPRSVNLNCAQQRSHGRSRTRREANRERHPWTNPRRCRHRRDIHRSRPRRDEETGARRMVKVPSTPEPRRPRSSPRSTVLSPVVASTSSCVGTTIATTRCSSGRARASST